MSSSEKIDDSDRKQLPEGNQRKRKQLRNGEGKATRRPRATVEIIDALLLGDVHVIERGVSRKIPALEAIVLQLLRKATSGNKRAIAVIHKYQQLVSEEKRSDLQIVRVESDYTRMLAAGSLKKGGQNE